MIKDALAFVRETVEEIIKWLGERIFGVDETRPTPGDDFDHTLGLLFPTEKDRGEFKEGALLLAKVGFTSDQFEGLARAVARGELTTPKGD